MNIIELEGGKSNFEEDLSEVVSKIKDTVVNIKCSSLTSQSAGSGVIIAKSDSKEEYYIVTNHHVINGYPNISVELADGNIHQAALVGGDPTGDIAIVKIEAEGLNIANILKDSDTLREGDSVIAIGNPLGELGGTVSRGIISFLGREIMIEGQKRTLIQTDAAVNSGNSGGGLFDINGNLIGIVNAKAAQLGVEGLAFAIPSNEMRYLAMEIMKTATDKNYGYVPGRTTIGATFVNGYYQSGGFFGQTYEIVYVTNVNEESAADKAGLRKEDIIISVTASGDTVIIEDALQIMEIIKSQEIGNELTFKIKRGGLNSPEIELKVICEQYIYTI
jgi:serine protease Do